MPRLTKYFWKRRKYRTSVDPRRNQIQVGSGGVGPAPMLPCPPERGWPMPDIPTDSPKRIQRKRTKGWKAPTNAVYVGRPTKWGNPYRVSRWQSPQTCVEKYAAKIETNLWTFPTKHDIQEELGGKDLICWCRLSEPCHADVLLELANQ